MPLELITSSLKSNEESLVAYGHLIFDAKVFARSFRSISFSHTHGKDKSITHNLVRHANHVKSFTFPTKKIKRLNTYYSTSK